jgi:hypothetical protein
MGAGRSRRDADALRCTNEDDRVQSAGAGHVGAANDPEGTTARWGPASPAGATRPRGWWRLGLEGALSLGPEPLELRRIQPHAER